MRKRQPSKPREPPKPEALPSADVVLTSVGAYDVAVHSATPKGPANKRIHARYPLPATPDAAPRPETSEKRGK